MIFATFFPACLMYFASLNKSNQVMKYLSWVAVLLFMSCGGEKVQPAEEHLAESENYAKWVDDKVGSRLAWRSISKFEKGDNQMAAWVGYIDGKAALVRLFSQGENQEKWWIYPDSATGKVLFFKEETPRDGKMVRNRISYRGDSVAIAMTSNEAYVSPYGDNDFRLKAAEVQALMDEAIVAVEADVKALSPEANAARRENAQFFATGGRNSWSLVINPSISTVTYRQPGAEDRKFGYDVPVTGPKNESIYTFNSLNGKIEVSIFGKACGSTDGRNYPYVVVIVDGSKSSAGCGVLLQ